MQQVPEEIYWHENPYAALPKTDKSHSNGLRTPSRDDWPEATFCFAVRLASWRKWIFLDPEVTDLSRTFTELASYTATAMYQVEGASQPFRF